MDGIATGIAIDEFCCGGGTAIGILLFELLVLLEGAGRGVEIEDLVEFSRSIAVVLGATIAGEVKLGSAASYKMGLTSVEINFEKSLCSVGSLKLSAFLYLYALLSKKGKIKED